MFDNVEIYFSLYLKENYLPTQERGQVTYIRQTSSLSFFIPVQSYCLYFSTRKPPCAYSEQPSASPTPPNVSGNFHEKEICLIPKHQNDSDAEHM